LNGAFEETQTPNVQRRTHNPPTPKASAWQALTRLAVAKVKEGRLTPKSTAPQSLYKL